MPETGLVVAGPEPIESIYTLQGNGLYLPPGATITLPAGTEFSVTMVGKGGGSIITPYPEFAQELVKSYNSGYIPYQPPIKKFYSKPRRKTLWDLVPALNMPYPARCPEYLCQHRSTEIMSMGIHLNDDHHWSREKIADWLDTLENVDLTVKVA